MLHSLLHFLLSFAWAVQLLALFVKHDVMLSLRAEDHLRIAGKQGNDGSRAKPVSKIVTMIDAGKLLWSFYSSTSITKLF